MTRLVKPGEKFEDNTIKGAYVSFEILRINMAAPEGEYIRLRENGNDVSYDFENVDPAALSTKLGFELQRARFQDAVDLYSRWTGRTVLLHPKIKWSSVSIRSAAQNEKEATAALEKHFREMGIASVDDGDKFVLLVPASIEKSVKLGPKVTDSDSPQEGSIYLESPVNSIIEFYGRMLGREQIRGDPIPGGQVYLRSGMLTKAEVLYAFDTLLGWYGAKVVLIDEKTFEVVPVPITNSP